MQWIYQWKFWIVLEHSMYVLFVSPQKMCTLPAEIMFVPILPILTLSLVVSIETIISKKSL